MKYLIYSRHHNRWWKAGGEGYTTCIELAGRYSKEAADHICTVKPHPSWDKASGASEFQVLAPETANTVLALESQVTDMAEDVTSALKKLEQDLYHFRYCTPDTETEGDDE